MYLTLYLTRSPGPELSAETFPTLLLISKLMKVHSSPPLSSTPLLPLLHSPPLLHSTSLFQSTRLTGPHCFLPLHPFSNMICFQVCSDLNPAVLAPPPPFPPPLPPSPHDPNITPHTTTRNHTATR